MSLAVYTAKGYDYLQRHPFWLFDVLFIGFFILTVLPLARLKAKSSFPTGSGSILHILSLLLLTGFCALTVWYLDIPTFLTQVEPQVPEVAWYYAQGHPLYPGTNSVEVYDLPYGPNVYLLTALFQKILGPSLFSSKLPTVLAYDLFLIALFLVYKKLSTTRIAILATGLAAAIVLRLDMYAVTARSDSLLCLGVAIGLWAAMSPSLVAPLILGTAVGLCFNFKVTGFLYFLAPAAVALRNGWGKRQIATALVCAVVSAIVPFVAFPNISAVNYLLFLKAVAGHGMSHDKMLDLLSWFAVLALPILLAFAAFRKRDPAAATGVLRTNRLLIVALLLEYVLLFPPASKYGAGTHHLMPWAVAVVFLGVQLYADGLQFPRATIPAAALSAWGLGVMASAFLAFEYSVWRLSEETFHAEAVRSDIRHIIDTYQGSHTILMGVGDDANYDLTYFRPYLTFAGMPIGIDCDALMDYKRASLPVPSLSALAAMAARSSAHEQGILWVIPRTKAPFTKNTVYPPKDALYDKNFQDAFKRDYHRIASTQFYDLYAIPSK